jgi:hypothetical protein
MPGIGYTSPINGSNTAFSIFARKVGSSGGAIQGWMPQTNQTVDKEYNEFEQIRFTLKEAWNTKYRTQLGRVGLTKSITTPFRAVNNAGDLLCRKYYSCGGPCQTPQSIPGVYGLSSRFGSISYLCDGTGVPPTSCNGKYVYDSSDYSTYRKQKAILSNYNKVTNGGDLYKAGQSAYKAIRRY